MRSPDDTTLTPEDRDLIERFRRTYAPPPPTHAERLAMQRTLRARLARRWVPAWPSLAAVACAAACALWFLLPDRSVTSPPSSAAGEVLAAYALEGDTSGDLEDVLPHEYAKIEYIFDL
jgi:hypothetical protein